MNARILVTLAGATAAVAIPLAGAATAAPSPTTPNQCVRHNGGDYTACNVGGSTRSGDGRYQAPAGHTPNDCIARNGADFVACNVGNSGRGDLPYRSATS